MKYNNIRKNFFNIILKKYIVFSRFIYDPYLGSTIHTLLKFYSKMTFSFRKKGQQ